MKKKTGLFILLGVVGILVIWLISAYNKMVKKDEACSQQWSKVESQYQRRLDLIPNLVSTVKGYAAHEQETLLQVIEARNQASGAKVDPNILSEQEIANYQATQDQLSGALNRLMVVVERYPDLKANENFLQLQTQLEGTENRIAVERQRFADVVNSYNKQIRSFPANLVAGMFGFDRKAYFASQSGAETAPAVSF